MNEYVAKRLLSMLMSWLKDDGLREGEKLVFQYVKDSKGIASVQVEHQRHFDAVNFRIVP